MIWQRRKKQPPTEEVVRNTSEPEWSSPAASVRAHSAEARGDASDQL